MKLKNVEVGQRVIIKRSTNQEWPLTQYHIGEEFEVISHEGPDYPKDGATVRVQKCGDARVVFWCNHKDLGRVKEKPAPAPKRDIKAELAAAWPWPEGTPVRCSASGNYPQRAHSTGYTIGNDGDGARQQPVRDAAGKFVCYAYAHDVLLDTEYKSWGRRSSRVVSALTEEQRTGPLRQVREGVRIKHSWDGTEAPEGCFYEEGDYRDNGDGTGTVLSLEEIFLDGLKK